MEEAAKSLGLQLQAWEVRSPQEIDTAFVSMSKAGLSGLVVFSDPVLLERPPIDHHACVQVPHSDCLSLEKLCRGGRLASYSANLLDMHRRAATYVDKIPRGAKPAELPVEQPTKFELVIN
jgi:putative tryptophan/tyrosine transport system substrate-binding protein